MGKRQRSSFLIGIFFSLSLQGLEGQGVFAAPPSSIPPPCLSQADATPLRLDLPPCTQVLSLTDPNSFLSKLQSYFSTQIQCYYQGFWVDSTSNQGVSQCSLGKSTSWTAEDKKVVCSLQDKEDVQNQLKESCGNPGNLDGFWEATQIRGLRVQAIKYFRNQVMQEIITQKALQIHSRCGPMAEDYQNLLKAAKKISLAATQSLSPQIQAQVSMELAQKKSFNFCNASSLSSGVLSQVPQMGACYLGLGKEHLTLLFGNIAQCEIWDRINTLTANFVDIQTKQLVDVIQTCTTQAIEVGTQKGNASLSQEKGEAAGTAQFKQCYSNQVRLFFQGVVDQLMPGTFSF